MLSCVCVFSSFLSANNDNLVEAKNDIIKYLTLVTNEVSAKFMYVYWFRECIVIMCLKHIRHVRSYHMISVYKCPGNHVLSYRMLSLF